MDIRRGVRLQGLKLQPPLVTELTKTFLRKKETRDNRIQGPSTSTSGQSAPSVGMSPQRVRCNCHFMVMVYQRLRHQYFPLALQIRG